MALNLKPQGLLKAIQSGKFPHLLLMSGQTETLAETSLWTAQLLLCTSRLTDGAPCEKCASCMKAQKKAHESLLVLEPDQAKGAGSLSGSLKVEHAAQVVDFLRLRPWSGNQVILISSVQLFTQQAANALLKSLEEPPPNTYFILTTEQPRLVLATIRSRSQKVHLRTQVNSGELESEAQAKRDEFKSILDVVATGQISDALVALEKSGVDKSDYQALLLAWQTHLASELKTALKNQAQSKVPPLRASSDLIAKAFKSFKSPADWNLQMHSLLLKLSHSLRGV